jgi:hypothetical protein
VALSRNRFLMAIIVAILVVSAFIMSNYVYVIPPAKIEVSMISESPSPPFLARAESSFTL